MTPEGPRMPAKSDVLSRRHCEKCLESCGIIQTDQKHTIDLGH